MKNGSSKISEAPEIAKRFVSLCEAFREAHRGRKEKTIGDRINYTIGYATLEAKEDSQSKFFKLTGVGAYKEVNGEAFYEVNEDALKKLEAMFLEKDKNMDSEFSL